jgi:hypothetical protein
MSYPLRLERGHLIATRGLSFLLLNELTFVHTLSECVRGLCPIAWDNLSPLCKARTGTKSFTPVEQRPSGRCKRHTKAYV